MAGETMGITYIEGVVKGPDGKEANLEFLVDSGATYSLLPKATWTALGLVPKRRMKFTLADGTSIERAVSEAFIAFPQGEGHTPVVLGEEGDQALLGVVTLEILGLVFNPFNRTLSPMQMMLA
jgi:clan AA aspartic protease